MSFTNNNAGGIGNPPALQKNNLDFKPADTNSKPFAFGNGQPTIFGAQTNQSQKGGNMFGNQHQIIGGHAIKPKGVVLGF